MWSTRYKRVISLSYALNILQIEEMEVEVENLKKERKQKIFQFESLDTLLKKVQNENKDLQKKLDKSMHDVLSILPGFGCLPLYRSQRLRIRTGKQPELMRIKQR